MIVLNRTGGPGLLIALNFDTFNHRTITCDTSFGPNVPLHDYAGHHPDIRTDGQGRATFTIPSNAFQSGQSYLCFSRTGLDRPIPVVGRTTTQVYFGAEDLDIRPAHDGQFDVDRIWCANGSPITLAFAPGVNPATWGAGATIALEVLCPEEGAAIGQQKWTHAGPVPAEHLRVKAAGDGWHTLRLASSDLPAKGVPFELTATYFATQEVHA